MVKLELQFVPHRRLLWLGLLFLAVAICVSGTILIEWRSLRRQTSQYSERIGELESALKERQRAIASEQAKASPQVEQRRAKYEQIKASLRYPWNRELAEIEQASDSTVAILSLSHEQSTGETQLVTEARDVASITKFVDKLNEDAYVGHWYILNYQAQTQSTPATVKANLLKKQ